jgi:lactate dehydrogenase-like 2-hydroxyacid dehydrogenase
MSKHANLGYIGLGNLGAPMAKRLVDSPGGITVYDIRVEALTPVTEAGATLADSVADVAAADIISVTVNVTDELRAQGPPLGVRTAWWAPASTTLSAPVQMGAGSKS